MVFNDVLTMQERRLFASIGRLPRVELAPARRALLLMQLELGRGPRVPEVLSGARRERGARAIDRPIQVRT